ncbi:flagellar filament capping protein FliD [Scatolibacter rhodanostii]|uniref:flagellar filament capping protein FliD n=1 Tax=Scatolibacter rhodanostii TaxID=2014781 RepID=UPI000C068275|nr:flagellar filament capping protein FliD [Scatolibacter rhodanostii]
MANISNSNYYSVGSSSQSSQGIAGLMSGMDTEEMVNKMLSGTQAKIDAQEALKQQTVWKQEIYRDIITSINTFNNKYFDTTYGSTLSTNFASSNFFNTMSSVIKSGNAVKVVSTGTNASLGNMKISVQSLASKAVLSNSSQKVSGNQTITGKALDKTNLDEQFGKKVVLKLSGKDNEISVDLNNVTTDDGMVKAFQDAVGTDVTVKMDEGRLTFITKENGPTLSLGTGSTTMGLKMTGLASASSTLVDAGTGSLVKENKFRGSQADSDAGYSFDLTLDGVQKTITLNKLGEDDTITLADIETALKNEVKNAFGSYVNVDLVNSEGKIFEKDKGLDVNSFNQIQFSLGKNMGTGHELLVTGVDANTIGIVPGTSSHINGSSKISELKGVSLVGDQFAFNINGTEFKFTGDTTISTMMNTINKSKAGVQISYSSLSDSFKIEATSSGAGYDIAMNQSEGNLLSVIFGEDVIASADKATSAVLTTKTLSGSGLTDDYKTKTATLKMNVNGKDYTFSLPKDGNNTYNNTTIETKFNEWLKTNFGDDNITYNSDNGLLSIKEGFVVKFDAVADSIDLEKAAETDLAIAFGFAKKGSVTSNVAMETTSLSDIHQFGDTAQGTISELLKDESGNSTGISFADGRLTVSEGANAEKLASVSTAFKNTVTFGDGEIIKKDKDGNDISHIIKGQDAKITVNGVETTRSSNSFTIDGVSLELTQVSAYKTGSTTEYEDTVLSTTRDTEVIVDAFKSFVEDYNAMLAKLNSYVGEEATYRNYDPLTTEQKKEMSEREITLWEENAKKGLIRNDSTVGMFLSEMRTALYSKPAGSSLALYDIGIETTSRYQDKGKLQLDEAALRKALSSNPEAVSALFTTAKEGLSAQLMTAMKKAASPSYASAGSLVQLAGISGATLEKKNTLYDRITSIETRIKQLQTKYNKERTRYWNQFTSMETIMSKFSTQQSMLSQQFSS